MSLSIVGTVGVPVCYGGFETLAENLLPSEKIDVVYCSVLSYEKKLKEYKGAKLVYIPMNANGIQSIFYDMASIFHSLFFTKNSILVLGVSGAIALPFFKLFTRRKVITNIDGLEWKRDKWNFLAKWFLRISESIAIKFSDIVITDNDAIAKYVFENYGKQSELIAYGGDHAVREVIGKSKEDYSLALCRIEPENNVEMILEAFSEISSEKIKFIGNWNNSNFGIELRRKYSVFSNIELIDPIYDLDILFSLREKAKWYLHGHSAGGTNPSLVEMMFFNIPIFCFNCDYNQATTEGKAIFFSNSNQLTDEIKTTQAKDGAGMKEVAECRYTWSIVKKQYENLF